MAMIEIGLLPLVRIKLTNFSIPIRKLMPNVVRFKIGSGPRMDPSVVTTN